MMCCNGSEMKTKDWLPLIKLLKGAGLEFSEGLTGNEVEHIEKTFSFRFPPDLCAFLKTAMPFWNSPRWRSGSESDIREWFDEPLRGILFDVERNEFWLPEWGEQPEDLPDALKIASTRIREAPKLIPILFNRFIPELPHEAGNPIFAVHQADIIYYGFDLEDYLRHEFNLPREEWPAQVRQIEFWDADRFQELRWG
jgi:hypothetical protein